MYSNIIQVLNVMNVSFIFYNNYIYAVNITFTGGGGSLNILTFLFCMTPLIERMFVLSGRQRRG